MWGKSERDDGDTSDAPAQTAAGELVQLNGAAGALAGATSLEDIKAIRDKAEAARKYVENARLGLEMQNHAAEVRLRAERAAGELLAKMRLAGGDRRSSTATSQLRLEDLGITKHQSSRWQRAARVPPEAFERFVRETKESGGELTTTALLTLARRFATPRTQAATTETVAACDRFDGIEQLLASGDRFPCVYADPPWGHQNETTRNPATKHYPPMSVEEIAALEVSRVAADDAHLHLWVTNGFLFEAPRVMESWGFEFRSCLVWVKPQMGLGDFWRPGHEFLLLGVRGSLKFQDRGVISWLRANRPRQSRKPEKVRKLIERVSPGPYLELFGRRRVRGWTVMGDEVDGDE